MSSTWRGCRCHQLHRNPPAMHTANELASAKWSNRNPVLTLCNITLVFLPIKSFCFHICFSSALLQRWMLWLTQTLKFQSSIRIIFLVLDVACWRSHTNTPGLLLPIEYKPISFEAWHYSAPSYLFNHVPCYLLPFVLNLPPQPESIPYTCMPFFLLYFYFLILFT